MSLLSVRDLSVQRGEVALVDGVSFDLEAGEVIGVAGPSGCGKTQLLLALMGLSPATLRVSGEAWLEQRNLLALPPRELARLRGDRIAIVFQDPMTSLNPFLTIGTQLTEVLRFHRGASRGAARESAATMLDAMHIDDAGRRLDQYPHELSGGMRQRVVIAMALLCEPAVLLADEPTTALDVTVQAQVLEVLAETTRRLGTAVVFVTHDFGVLAHVAQRIVVMQAGRIVEQGDVVQVFAAPSHPCTRELLDAARERVPA